MDEDYDFPGLFVPSCIEEALSYEQQVLYLDEHKQNKLVEGENITLTDNVDGTTTVSSTGSSTPGTTATIEVGTVVDGETAAVTNVGTTSAAVFDFVLPKGEDGVQGPIGETGPAGADGAQGPIGLTGPAGADGAQGPIGLTGPQGEIGPQGIQGETGPAGADGAQGPIGETGPAGADGAQGPIGLTGATGADGAQGPIGLTGATGADGAQGIQGEPGPAGTDGAQGPIGLTGATGADGAQGPIGLTGPAGADGAQGSAGPSNVTPILTDGTEIADINGTKIYAPAGGGGGGLEYIGTLNITPPDDTLRFYTGPYYLDGPDGGTRWNRANFKISIDFSKYERLEEGEVIMTRYKPSSAKPNYTNTKSFGVINGYGAFTTNVFKVRLTADINAYDNVYITPNTDYSSVIPKGVAQPYLLYNRIYNDIDPMPCIINVGSTEYFIEMRFNRSYNNNNVMVSIKLPISVPANTEMTIYY